MVGMARRKENSAAALRSTPKSRAKMMVAPERLVPGIMASTWPKPISRALSGPISAMEWMFGLGRLRSMMMSAMPPMIRAKQTT